MMRDELDTRGRYNVRQAAEALGVHENTIRNWVATGVLRAQHYNGAWIRISSAEVNRMLMVQTGVDQGGARPHCPTCTCEGTVRTG